MARRNPTHDKDESAEEFWPDELEDQNEGPAGTPRRMKSRRTLVEILYQDEDLVVVNKPAGLPTGLEESAPDTVMDQLADRLKARDGDVEVLEHMDAGVSGVLLVAISSLARREMPRRFARDEIEKTYVAIVRAAPTEQSGVIDLEIGPDKSGPVRMRVGGSHARPAVTNWTLRDRFAGFAVVECRTKRERIDQVRLHLQAAGMPLAVDTEYGGTAELMLSSFKPDYRPSRRHEERPLIGRISLHAQSIAFKHPRRDEPMRFEVPPPKDFRATLNQLDKHGRIGIPPKAGDG